ncbi:MAG: hypoxanthine/guanine phosphoribosyltransferase [Candidatus Poseidoniaceae archaeon]|nr:hypoxanthine/guanine phosphoribosyltransferase [Candidatus Poseidoniaceae archaeon]
MREIEILKESLVNAPIIWKGDYPYFIHPITDGVPRLEPEVLKAVIELSIPLIDWGSVDMILGIEAMGLPLMAPLSMRTGIPMVIGRKRQYGLEGEIEINQETGYSKGSIFLNDIKQGENLVIIDDVLSTGGTIRSVIEGVKKTGAIIQNIVVVVEKGPGMATLQKDYPEIRFDSLVKLEMDGEKVVILDRGSD